MGRGPDLAETIVDDRAGERSALPRAVCIGRYELRDVLGGGGQGVVYKALQRGAVEQTVAIKTLRAEGLAAEGDVKKFLQEMRLMTELDHPGLVSILDSGIEDGRPFLAMPLMVGGSLTSRLKDGGLPDPKTAARWMAEIARAVQYLHDKNMVHRDLKPSNILFDAHGQPRVADFGLMRLVEQAGGTGQASAVVLEGTASYMAPEQAAGRIKSVGRRTDIYGMGAILYEILTSRPPFRTDSFMKTLARVIEDEPEPPRRLRPEIPVELEAICLKCLAKDPGVRYDSAGKLADELDRFRHGLPLELTHPPGILARVGRWARREPGFATRLTIVIGCTVVIGFNWLTAAAGVYHPERVGWSIGPLSGGPESKRWINLALLFAWGLAAAGIPGFPATEEAGGGRRPRVDERHRAARDRPPDHRRPAHDPAHLGLRPAHRGIGALVATRVVAFTMALAMIGYLVLIAEGWAYGKPIGFRYGHVDFLVGLALMGFITAYQARRVRALGRLIEEGPEG